MSIVKLIASGNWSANGIWDKGSTPDATDDVILDNAYNVIVDTTSCVAKTILQSGSGTLTINNSMKLTVSGNVTFAAGKFIVGGNTAELAMLATGTLITAGNIMGALTFNGASQTFTLGNAVTTRQESIVTLTEGSLITGSYTHNFGQYSSNNLNNRTVNITGTTINITTTGGNNAFNISGGDSNNIITDASSIINFLGNNLSPNFGGKTFLGSVNFNGANLLAVTVSGSNTFHNLSFDGSAKTLSLMVLSLSDNQTIDATGTLTLKGGADNRYRLLVQSNTLGTERSITLTNGATLVTQRVDFRDIKGVGTGTIWDLSSYATCPGGAGDCGNSVTCGIIFPTARTLYWYSTGAYKYWTANTGTNPWYTDDVHLSNLSGLDSPLPQDNVIINNNSIPTTGKTINIDSLRPCKDLNLTGATNSPTITVSSSSTIYGSLTLISGMTFTHNNNTITFGGRGTHTITSGGKTFYDLYIQGVGASYTLLDNLTISRDFYITAGSFYVNNFNIASRSYILTSTPLNTRAFYMGNGIVESTMSAPSNYILICADATNLTINCGQSTFKISGSNSTGVLYIIPNIAVSFYNLQISGNQTSSGSINFYQDFTVTNIFTIAAPNRIRIASGKTITLGPSASLVWIGSAGSVIEINVVSGTTPFTISRPSGTQIFSCDWLLLNYCTATQTNTFYAGANSTGDNDLNWKFVAAPVSSGNMFLMFD